MSKCARILVFLSAAALFLSIGALEPLLHDHDADDACHASCLACQWLSSPFIETGIVTLIAAILFIAFAAPLRKIQDSQAAVPVGAIRGPPRHVSP